MFPNFQYLQKVLRNILLCSLYRILGKLKYPNKILPKSNFKNLIEFDSLFKSQSVYLLRRSDLSLDLTFNTIGDLYTLKEDILSLSDFPNMSVNLIGGKFKIKHAKFIIDIKSDACKKWDGKSSVFLSDHIESYSIADALCHIFIDPTNIHELNIPYDKPYDKNLENLLKSLEIDIKPENKKYHFTGKIKFVSEPANLNYWHFELKIYDFKNEPIDYKSSAWLKELCRQILCDVVSVNTSPLVPSVVKIPSKFYKK